MYRFSRACNLFFVLLLLTACTPLQAIQPNAPTNNQSIDSATDGVPPAINNTATMTPEEIYAEATSRLDRFLALIDDLRATIDRTQFDLTELGFALGFDAEPIVAFVRDEIAFEQYPGVLRGAQGTLLGRAGNALDQALLLRVLLDDAGYETRLNQGILHPEDAALLLQGLGASRPSVQPPGDLEAMQAIFNEMGALSFEPPAEVEALIDASFAPPPLETLPLYQKVQQNRDSLTSALLAAGIDLEKSQLVPTHNELLLQEAQSYHWVEYRLGPTDSWQAGHPAFGSSSPDLSTLVADEIYNNDIPAALYHRLQFQALIEHQSGDERATVSLFEPMDVPVSTIVGQPLTYHNHPNGVTDLNELADLATVLQESELFLPIFNQEIVPGAHAFDVDGNLFDGEMGADNSLELAPLGQALGGAIDMLGALGGTSDGEEDTADSQLTAYQLKFTLITPNGDNEEFIRTIWSAPQALPYDNSATSNVATAELAMRATLATQHTFMVAPGKINTAFILDQTLARVAGYAPLLRHMLTQNVLPDQAEPLTERTVQTVESAWLGHLSLYKAFDAIGETMPDHRLYRAAPTLVRYSQRLVDNRIAHALDILNNRQRAFVIENGVPVAAPLTALQAGIWETFVESELLSGPDMVITASAATQLDHAATQNNFTILTAENRDTLQKSSLPATTQSFIAQDLDAGFVVAMPATALTDSSVPAVWWRVDPQSGTTVGRLSNGFGGVMAQTMTEYAIKIGAHVILFTMAFAHCIGIIATTTGKVGGGQILGCIGLSLAFAFARFPTDIVDGILLFISISGLFVC